MDADCPCCAPPWAMQAMLREWNCLKITDDGVDVKWIYRHGDLPNYTSNQHVNDIVYDSSSDRLYLSESGTTSGNSVVRKLLPSNAALVWKTNLGAAGGSSLSCQGLAVSSTGVVAVCPSNTTIGSGSNRLRTLGASTGATVWDVPNAANPNTSVNFDSSGNLYTSTNNRILGEVGTTIAWDSSGTLLWATGHGATSGNCVYVATDSNLVCSVGLRGTGANIDTTRVFDMSGVLQWSKDHGARVNGCAFMSNGNIVTVGAVSGSVTTRCYDSSGTQQWTANHTASVNHVCVDEDDNVYTAGDYVSGVGNVRKYDSSGTLLWSFDYTLGKGSIAANGVAVDNSGYVYIGGNLVTF